MVPSPRRRGRNRMANPNRRPVPEDLHVSEEQICQRLSIRDVLTPRQYVPILVDRVPRRDANGNLLRMTLWQRRRLWPDQPLDIDVQAVKEFVPAKYRHMWLPSHFGYDGRRYGRRANRSRQPQQAQQQYPQPTLQVLQPHDRQQERNRQKRARRARIAEQRRSVQAEIATHACQAVQTEPRVARRSPRPTRPETTTPLPRMYGTSSVSTTPIMTTPVPHESSVHQAAQFWRKLEPVMTSIFRSLDSPLNNRNLNRAATRQQAIQRDLQRF